MASSPEASSTRAVELYVGDQDAERLLPEDQDTPAADTRGAVIFRRSFAAAVAGLALVGSAVLVTTMTRPGNMLRGNTAEVDIVRSESKAAEYMHSYIKNIAKQNVNDMVSNFSPNGMLVFQNKGMIESFTTPADVEVGLKLMYKAVEDRQCVDPKKKDGSSAEHTSSLTWGCPGHLVACMFTSFNNNDVMHYWDIDKMSVNLDGPCVGDATKDPLRKNEY